MRLIDQQAMTEIIERCKDEDVSQWDTTPSDIYIDNDKIVFQAHSEQDAERILYAMMAVISHQCNDILGTHNGAQYHD